VCVRGNDLKHGTVVVFNTVSQHTDFGFKRSRVGLALGFGS